MPLLWKKRKGENEWDIRIDTRDVKTEIITGPGWWHRSSLTYPNLAAFLSELKHHTLGCHGWGSIWKTHHPQPTPHLQVLVISHQPPDGWPWWPRWPSSLWGSCGIVSLTSALKLLDSNAKYFPKWPLISVAIFEENPKLTWFYSPHFRKSKITQYTFKIYFL